MMRTAAVLAMLLRLAACAPDAIVPADGSVAPADVMTDGLGDGLNRSCPVNADLCSGGLGWCDTGTCRPFCRAAAYPRCGTGTVEHNVPDGERDVCVCVPG